MTDQPKMDRRARIREYRDGEPPMGVFAVRNKANGRWLVGVSTDLPSTLSYQRAQLRAGTHANRDMQSDWNALGAETFAFEILEEISRPESDLSYDPVPQLESLREQWAGKLRGMGRSYEAELG